MPKITEEPLKLIQVRIFERDYERLNEMFGGDPSFTITAAVRTIIRTMLNQLEDKVNTAIDKGEDAAGALPRIDLENMT